MTSSRPLPWVRAALVAVLLSAHAACVWAALGETQASIDAEGARLGARRSIATMAHYTVQDLHMPDGSRVRQYLAGNGQVFAVQWNTLSKPDLSVLLGQSFAGYAGAAQVAARRGGIQRQFRHDDTDLVVQTTGHMHVYAGYAFRRTLLPQGVRASSMGWE